MLHPDAPLSLSLPLPLSSFHRHLLCLSFLSLFDRHLSLSLRSVGIPIFSLKSLSLSRALALDWESSIAELRHRIVRFIRIVSCTITIDPSFTLGPFAASAPHTSAPLARPPSSLSASRSSITISRTSRYVRGLDYGFRPAPSSFVHVGCQAQLLEVQQRAKEDQKRAENDRKQASETIDHLNPKLQEMRQ